MQGAACTLFLYAAEPPRITAHPKEQKDTVLGKPVTFTVQATGTEPLNYQWEIYPRDGIGGWQPCDELPGGNSFTLMIPSVHKSNEGSYHCIISNAVGSQTSVSVILSTGKNQMLCNRLCTKKYHTLYLYVQLSLPRSVLIQKN